MENYIRYKGKGEHSINELEKIIEQREEELRLLRSNQEELSQHDVVSQVCDCPFPMPNVSNTECLKCKRPILH